MKPLLIFVQPTTWANKAENREEPCGKTFPRGYSVCAADSNKIKRESENEQRSSYLLLLVSAFLTIKPRGHRKDVSFKDTEGGRESEKKR